VATTTDQAWRSGFETVFLGAVRLVRTLAAELGGQRQGGAVAGSVTGTGGSLVLVLASSARVPLVDLAISNGLFPGLAGVVKMLAGELGPAGIRVNGVLPVRIATDRVRELDARSGDPDGVRARLSAHIPLRRYGEPEEFGRAAAFLLSPAASFITGAMIRLMAVPSDRSEHAAAGTATRTTVSAESDSDHSIRVARPRRWSGTRSRTVTAEIAGVEPRPYVAVLLLRSTKTIGDEASH
jgi:NAD(P)-dependent dehydrogenase (short-subunit alcohol dehydrogenase family)